MLRAVWQPTPSDEPRRGARRAARGGWGLELPTGREARDLQDAGATLAGPDADRRRKRRIVSGRLAGRLGDWSPRCEGLKLR